MVNNISTTLDQLVFADILKKKNRFGFQQKRIIVITDNAIYNIKEKSLQRKVFL